jgi:HK97 family phage portal protein
MSDAGVKVSHDTALMYAPFWEAVSIIADDISCFPFELHERINEDSAKRLPTDRLTKLVNVQPNEDTDAVTFWNRFMVHCLAWGNGYAWILRNGRGEPDELLNLLPDRTAPERVNGQLIYITELATDNGPKLKAILPEDIIHVAGLGYQNGVGCDLVRYARNALGLGLAQEKFGSAFFKHGGRQGGILELPLGMPKPARDTVEEGFRRSYEGADNPFRTVVLRDNAKFHAAQVSPQESQLVEANESQVRNVARLFKLPPSKLGLSDSVSYNSKSEDNQSYLQQSLRIWMKRIAAQCNIKLLLPRDQDTYFFDYDPYELLQMNPSLQAESLSKLIAARVINPNEARVELNMLPYAGGDEFVNPNTMKSGNEPGSPPPEPKPARSGEYLRTLFSITARAREKAKHGNTFVLWVDGKLAPYRAEYRKQDEPFPFDSIESGFRKIADTTPEASLQDVVHIYCQKLEDQWNDVTV